MIKIIDVIILLMIWLPIELGLFGQNQLAGVAFTVAGLITLLLLYKLRYSTKKLPAVNWLLFFQSIVLLLAVVIPFGLATNFLQLGLTHADLIGLLRFLLIEYFLIALAEEVLFRGLILQMLERLLGNSRLALFGSAFIFGLAHINNTTLHHAPPNYLYVVSALGAGLCYGVIFQQSRRITVSALAHVCINLIWCLFLRGGLSLPV